MTILSKTSMTMKENVCSLGRRSAATESERPPRRWACMAFGSQSWDFSRCKEFHMFSALYYSLYHTENVGSLFRAGCIFLLNRVLITFTSLPLSSISEGGSLRILTIGISHNSRFRLASTGTEQCFTGELQASYFQQSRVISTYNNSR